MLDSIEIKGRTITADALLTQRELAKYLVEKRCANYHFTVKKNQGKLFEDISYYFQHSPTTADFTHTGNGKHGWIETRKIWVSKKLNHYLDFPYVGQAFMIHRESIDKKTGQLSQEVSYGNTSVKTDQASPEQVLGNNRKHGSIESFHYIIDWNYDEDRCRIRTGHGPQNITRLRRFAIGLLKSKKPKETIPEKMKKLMLNRHAVFDYLKMTRNSNRFVAHGALA